MIDGREINVHQPKLSDKARTDGREFNVYLPSSFSINIFNQSHSYKYNIASLSWIVSSNTQIHCAVSNYGLVWFGMAMVLSIVSPWIYCCVLFIRNCIFERRCLRCFAKQIINDLVLSWIVFEQFCPSIRDENLFLVNSVP